MANMAVLRPHFVVLLYYFTAVTSEGEKLQCYHCEANGIDSCTSNSNKVVECAAQITHCVTARIQDSSGSQISIARRCASENEQNPFESKCTPSAESSGVSECLSYCSHSLCNSGSGRLSKSSPTFNYASPDYEDNSFDPDVSALENPASQDDIDGVIIEGENYDNSHSTQSTAHPFFIVFYIITCLSFTLNVS